MTRGVDPGVHPSDAPDAPDVADVAAARVFVRRLYADPLTGEVFARDARRRLFSEAQRALVVSRDRYCRTPWCGAPIRHVDHRVRHRDGGATSVHNGQGLCQRCNQGRERPRQAAVPPTLYLRPGAVLPRISPCTTDGRLPAVTTDGRLPSATTQGRPPARP